MIDVRIVCARDAEQTALEIKRLLSAEGFAAEVTHGRGSLNLLTQSCERREAVVLIWSLNAPTTEYMLKWATATDPMKLAEIARAPIWPPLNGRRASVIDFSQWTGGRGNVAWRELEERLRYIDRSTEPKRSPPKGPALALAGAGLMAAAGALTVRIEQSQPMETVAFEQPQLVESPSAAPSTHSQDGWGGPLVSVEPVSVVFDGDESMQFGRIRANARMIDGSNVAQLSNASLRIAPPLRLREASLLDRIADWTAPIVGENEK